MLIVEDLCMNAQYALRSAIRIISLFSGEKNKRCLMWIIESCLSGFQKLGENHSSILFWITNLQNWRFVLNDMNLSKFDCVQAQRGIFSVNLQPVPFTLCHHFHCFLWCWQISMNVLLDAWVLFFLSRRKILECDTLLPKQRSWFRSSWSYI